MCQKVGVASVLVRNFKKGFSSVPLKEREEGAACACAIKNSRRGLCA